MTYVWHGMAVKRTAPWRVGRKRGLHLRKRHGFLAHSREYIWPSMGLRAFVRWLMLKLLRQADRPHYVALGVAIGVMVGFSPVIGTHTLLILAFCVVLRASFLAGLTGSMISNPWTVGPILAGSFKIGHWILGATPAQGLTVEHLNTLSWGQMADHFVLLAEHIIVPMIVGGLVLSAPIALIAYISVYWWLRCRRDRDAV